MDTEKTFANTREAARFFTRLLRTRDAQQSRETAHSDEHSSALVVALYGDLGAGKTTFVQHVAEAFGITERVISPTFILQRTYALPEAAQPFTHFIHIDAYRLEESSELDQLGWNDIVTHPQNIIFIEWADRVEDALPENTMKIHFEFEGEEGRKIRISNFEF